MYYSYNFFNQQTKVLKSDASSLESQYDAFGVIRDCQDRFANRILYTGQQYDPIIE